MKPIHSVKEILKEYKPKKLTHFKCKKCNGEWDSLYDYKKCPVCKGEIVKAKGIDTP